MHGASWVKGQRTGLELSESGTLTPVEARANSGIPADRRGGPRVEHRCGMHVANVLRRGSVLA